MSLPTLAIVVDTGIGCPRRLLCCLLDIDTLTSDKTDVQTPASSQATLQAINDYTPHLPAVHNRD